MPQEHPIRVVAMRTGLTPHVIRIWEKRYSAVIPSRTATNRRFYTDEDIDRLSLLRRATNTGRSIGQIARLPLKELQELVKSDELLVAAGPGRFLPVSIIIRRRLPWSGCFSRFRRPSGRGRQI